MASLLRVAIIHNCRLIVVNVRRRRTKALVRTYVGGHSIIPEHNSVRLPFDTSLVITTLVYMVVKELEDIF